MPGLENQQMPVVDGRPDAEEQEVRASEALGEPVREGRDSDEVTSPRAEKKAKAKPQCRKRYGENLDDFYHELEETKAPAVSAGASGSSGLGMPRTNFGPEPRDGQRARGHHKSQRTQQLSKSIYIL